MVELGSAYEAGADAEGRRAEFKKKAVRSAYKDVPESYPPHPLFPPTTTPLQPVFFILTGLLTLCRA